MGKPKPGGKQNIFPKELKSIKDGFIQKKKTQKFKQTPAGKVTLINGSKMQNNQNIKQQKQTKKETSASPKKSPQNNVGNKNSPKSKNKQSPQKQLNKKLLKKFEEDDSESDEDINEGVYVEEQFSFVDDNDEEESDEDDVPDIFGTSLAEDSDEDDDDFDEEEEEEDDDLENKGVKMFKGLKNKGSDSNKSNTSSGSEVNTSSSISDSSNIDDDDDDDDEDDDDEETEEESDEEANESALGLKTLLENSILDEDDDDEDFEAVEEEEEEEEEEEIGDDSESEDSDDNESEDEENSTPTSKSPEEVKPKRLSPEEQLEVDKRTIFVGNISRETSKKKLSKLFSIFGKITNLRFRGIVPEDAKMSTRVAAITKKLHPKLKTLYAYIAFEKEESAKKALSMNGKVFDGHYLRVDTSVKTDKKYDLKKSVFIGNLPFKVDTNKVWEHFKRCGEVEYVRLIKDRTTGVGKGVGFVSFKTADAVPLALELNGEQFLNRELRVRVCTKEDVNRNLKDKQGNKRSLSQESDNKNNASKKAKMNTEVVASASAQNRENAIRRKNKKGQNSPGQQSSPQGKGTFQGQKADLSKKKKPSKLEKKKKVLAAKLTAKPKKPLH